LTDQADFQKRLWITSFGISMKLSSLVHSVKPRGGIRLFAIAAVVGGTLALSSCAQAEQVIAYLISPTPTITLTITASATATNTVTLTPSVTSSPSRTPLPTATDTPDPSDTPTLEPTITSTITPGPSPTPTRTASRTRWPTLTKVPTRTRTITNTPTVTYTPTPGVDAVRINRPGVFSKVSSPFRIESHILVGDDGYVHLDLLGEDNRVITARQLDYRGYVNRNFLISDMMDFNITAVSETGRLLLYTKDLSGRMISVASVDLILMALGANEITPSLQYWEPYIIRYPRADQTMEGGTLLVMGVARPVNNTPLIIELIDEQGKIVGSTNISVDQPTGDLTHTPFQVAVSYSVSDTTPVRLTIRQESDQRIPGTVALYSMKIVLKP
jgi:hypothetical protein